MLRFGLQGRIAELLEGKVEATFSLARVVAEHRERYVIATEEGTLQAEITGQLRYAALQLTDFPAVGDWVRAQILDDRQAMILELYPRTSYLSRQTVGKQVDEQILAANIDVAMIMQSVGFDFNVNRLERYLTICQTGNIEPMVLLSKIDLITQVELDQLLVVLKERLPKIKPITMSTLTGAGLEQLKSNMHPHLTYCILGSSGVGKSSLVNYLKGATVMRTKTISEQTNKGRHTTSHRELFILSNESIIIDTPGMREIGMANAATGIEVTFEEISGLASSCRFKDCQHVAEPGCAVRAALEAGTIQQEAFDNYQKLMREEDHYRTSLQDQRRKDRKMGKFYKSVMARKRKMRDGD